MRGVRYYKLLQSTNYYGFFEGIYMASMTKEERAKLYLDYVIEFR